MANPLAQQLLAAQGQANVQAFERVVRFKESSEDESAYTEIFGGSHVSDLSDHPFRNRPHIPLPDGRTTSAAGAYQAEIGTWDDFQRACGPRDFSEQSQDLFAVWCFYRRHALNDILAGDIGSAIVKCRQEWTSLPGAQESSGKWTIEKAVALFQQYGGTLLGAGAAGVPAPDIPQPTQPDPVVPTTQGEPDMGALLTGLIPQLLMSVVSGFSNPQTAQQVTSLVTNDSGKKDAIAGLLSTLLGAVAKAAGVTPEAMQADPKVAIAAVSAVQADPAKLAAVEDAAKAHLDAVMSVLPALMQADAALWAAQNQGKEVSSNIAIEEHKAGLWDMTPTIVRSLLAMLGAVAIGLLVAIGIIIFKEKPDTAILGILVGLAGPIWTGAIVATVVAIGAYRFDGSKESHAAAEAQRATERYREETGKA